jgi:aspartate/methionine/tyrosine aminotransferase
VLEREEIRHIVAWARRKRLQLIFDEVYAMSIHVRAPEEVEVTPFASVAEVLGGDLGPDVHIVWGLSKDFCVAGARVGVLFSQNGDVLVACQKYSMACSVSTSTQHEILCILSDDAFIRRFILANQKKLTDAKRNLIRYLDYLRIPYVPASAGFFLWIDLRHYMMPFLDGQSEENAELCLWKCIAQSKVLLNAGSDYSCGQPGWFRCCFAMVNEQTMHIAWSQRVCPVLKRLR